MQGKSDTRTHYGFEKQFCNVYTKAVFAEFRIKLKKSTLFGVRESTEGHPHYLVQYRHSEKEFSWSQHQFKVEANPEKGKYKCECILWEHTGIKIHKLLDFVDRHKCYKVQDKNVESSVSKSK